MISVSLGGPRCLFFYPLVTPADEPTTFNNFNLTWEQEGEEGVEALELELWDTAGDSTSAYL